jgi:hypothetical protein
MQVRQWIIKVLDAAKRVAANPNDPAAQAALSEAQRGLAAAIQALVSLTKGKAKNEVDEALRSLNEATKDDPKASAVSSKSNVLSLLFKTFFLSSFTFCYWYRCCRVSETCRRGVKRNYGNLGRRFSFNIIKKTVELVTHLN